MPHHDLLVIGAGSGNMILDSFPDLDVAVVEEGRFGGTCLNRGCIPTKMLSYTAELARHVRAAGVYGLDARLAGVRWRAVRDRVFGRLDADSAAGRDGRLADEKITTYTGHARFTGPRTVTVELDGSEQDGADVGASTAEVTADRIVLAAGSRPLVPEPFASGDVPYDTSDTIMRIDEVPARLAVVGGGYIAAELAQVFGSLGSAVTIIEKAPGLLGPQDETIRDAYTGFARTRFDLRCGTQVESVTGAPGAIRLTLDDGEVVEVDRLLVAIGRIPNADRLDAALGGIATTDDGRVAVDEFQRSTSAEGVWALGDICTPVPLKHVANREAHVVAHNIEHPDERIRADHDLVPAAIFTDPQIGQVGRTEQQCRDEGLDYVVGTHRYADIAYGWALEEDGTGLCKIIAERGSGRLLGAHVLGPEATVVVAPLVVAMTFGVTASELAQRPYWIHPTLSEVVENALRDLDA